VILPSISVVRGPWLTHASRLAAPFFAKSFLSMSRSRLSLPTSSFHFNLESSRRSRYRSGPCKATPALPLGWRSLPRSPRRQARPAELRARFFKSLRPPAKSAPSPVFSLVFDRFDRRDFPEWLLLVDSCDLSGWRRSHYSSVFKSLSGSELNPSSFPLALIATETIDPPVCLQETQLFVSMI